MLSRLSLAQKGLIAVIFVLLLEGVFVGCLARMLHDAETQIDEERRVQAIIAHMNTLSNLWQKSANHLGKFLELSDLNNAAAASYASTAAAIRHYRRLIEVEFTALKSLLQGSPSEVRSVLFLENATKNFLDSIDQVGLGYQANLDTGNDEPYYMALLRFSKFDDECTDSSEVLLAKYRKLDDDNHKRAEDQRQQMRSFLYAGLALNTGIALAIAWWFVSGMVRRLSVISENSVRLAAGEPLAEEQSGEDEIANLDRAFHDMARALDESIRKERAVVDNALDVICSIDANARFVEVNPASLAIWGFVPGALAGRRYLDIVAPEDIERVRKAFEEVVTKPSDAPIEIRIICRNGTIADMLWSVHWSAKDQAWFCVAHDVTERRKVEQLKQDFMAMVGHDLRTPLNSVAGTLHMLIEGMYDLKTENGMTRAKAAESNVWRLIDLVNDLLDIEKLAAGQLVLELEPVSIASIVRQALEMVSNVAEQAKITIDAQPCDAQIMADEDRLVHVVVNLLSNAIKFSTPDSTVKITCKELPDSVEIKIIDNGRGIPPELQESVFDRFKQVKTADGKRHKGTGLGLAICKEIVLLHGGTIGVESEPDHGSTFWIRIPLAK